MLLKVGVLITSNGKLLLIKEKSSYDEWYHWNIVKGTFEPKNDGSLLEAVKREAREETGATIKNIRLFNVFEVRKGGKSILQVNFLASSKNKNFHLPNNFDQVARSEDITEIKLFDKKALRKMKRLDFINERAYLTIRDWITDSRGSFKLLS